MRCLYCGKKLGLLKRAHGEEFCTPQHHDAYAKQAENALKRLHETPAEKEGQPPTAPAISKSPAVNLVADVSTVTPAAPEPAAPPMASLVWEPYPAQMPREGAKLNPTGPEEIALTPPVPPKMNLRGAAEMHAPLSIQPVGSSVLTIKAISVSARATNVDALEFLGELARPRLAVSPVTEGLSSAGPPEAKPEPKVEECQAAPSVEQKPIFEAEFESPWTLAVVPPLARDLAIPAQLLQINLRLMDSGRLEHHPLPVTTSGLSVDTCFSDAPVSKMRAGGLPAERPVDPLKKPPPTAAGHAAALRIRQDAERVSEAAESIEPGTTAAGFAARETMYVGLPRAISGPAVPVVSRPDELIPIEKTAAGAGLFRTGAGAKSFGQRSTAVLPKGPAAYEFAAAKLADLCPAVREKSQGAQVEFGALAAAPPVRAILRTLHFPRKLSAGRTTGLKSSQLEISRSTPVTAERPACGLRAVAMDLRVPHVGSKPIEIEDISTTEWKRPISPDRVGPAIARVDFPQENFPPSAVIVSGECRLSGPGSPELASLRFLTIAELRHLPVNHDTLRPVSVPEILSAVATRLARFDAPLDLLRLDLSDIESGGCIESIQPDAGPLARSVLAGGPALTPAEWNALPGVEVVAGPVAITRQTASVEWVLGPVDPPKNHTVVKFLPVRRGLILRPSV